MPSAPRRRRASRAAFAFSAVAVSALAALPAAASADVTGAAVTSPSTGTFFETPDWSAVDPGPAFTVAGTATVVPGDGPDAVTVWAETRLSGDVEYQGVAAQVPVVDGRFSVAVPAYELPTASSRLFVLPADASPYDDAVAVPPGGPIVHGGGAFVARDEDGRVEFFGGAQRAQPGGAAATGTVSGDGYGPLRAAASRAPSYGAGITAGATTDGNDLHGVFLGSSTLVSGFSPARGALTVDGRTAWPRDGVTWSSRDDEALERRDATPADGLTTDELEPVQVDRTVGGDWGQTVVERQRVYASADPEDGGYAEPDGLVDTGLELVRTVVQDHDGRRITVRDEYRATDGRAHQVDALYAMGVVTPGSPMRRAADDAPDAPAFRVPWEAGGDRFASRAFLDPLGSPRGDVATLYTRVPPLSEDSDGAPAYGAITFGTRVDGGIFMPGYASSGLDAASAVLARFVREVPAGGAATIPVVYSTGTTAGEVEGAAARVERELTPVVPPAQPPATTPERAAVPVPVPRSVVRVAPRRLTLRTTTKRLRGGGVQVRLRGALALPAGTPAAVCAKGGTVALQIRVGKRTLSGRRVRLAKDCTYDVKVRFASTTRFGAARRLTVAARWNGNAAVGTAASAQKRVAVR